MTAEQTTAEGYSYTLQRMLESPVAAVWNAWTTAESYAQWSYAAPGSVEMDVRPGGTWKATMVTPDGGEFPLTGSYSEVDENRRLVIGMDVPGRAEPVLMTVELAEQGAHRTRIVVAQTCDTAADRDLAEQGTTMLLDSLTAFLRTAR
ncbi:SRPBCC domain-containing protein [Actinacidiphila glaucinigra]|uniref:SRPBCC family protein n=1 Tax=Actinacidiphila glaucinigra TaxID=235986 RepID=UPI002DD8B57A|nr:SRPBCC domain-containing protein [Actinacidiphila glaucinigra]WSD61958.1 SRPBCC domain-containing protein [Actinacidiphila glaucinigra]